MADSMTVALVVLLPFLLQVLMLPVGTPKLGFHIWVAEIQTATDMAAEIKEALD